MSEVMAAVDEKLHVYIAASARRLVEVRRVALGAVLRAGHWPGGSGILAGEVGEPATLVPAWIAAADVLLVVLGRDGGGEAPEAGSSMVSWEIALARAAGVPVVAIVLAEPEESSARRRPPAQEGESIAALRQRLVAGGAATVESEEGLALAITLGLAERVREGAHRWVRDDAVRIDAAVAVELARLSQRCARLEAERGRGAGASAPRAIAGHAPAAWAGILASRTVRDLRTRQVIPLGRALLEHAGALALGVGGDKSSPLEVWLHGEVAALLLALGLVGEAGARLALNADGKALVAALLADDPAPREETVVASGSDPALRARSGGEGARAAAPSVGPVPAVASAPAVAAASTPAPAPAPAPATAPAAPAAPGRETTPAPPRTATPRGGQDEETTNMWSVEAIERTQTVRRPPRG